MIKVLYLGLYYGDKHFNNVIDSFRKLGCHVEFFNYFGLYEQNRNVKKIRKMLIEKANEYKPDLIHAQIQHTTVIDGETFRIIKEKNPNTIIVNFTIDARNYIPPTYKSVAKYSDYNLICSTGQIDLYKNQGINNVRFWQVGYDPNLYYPETITRTYFDYDIVFAGNVNPKENYPGHQERMKTMYALRKSFGNRFGLFGSGWPKDLQSKGSIDQNNIVKDVYHKSFSTLSVSHFNQINHYFSDRLLMCLASGRPTVCWRFPKYHSYFVDKCDLILAEGPDDVVAKVRYLLDNPDEANYIGKNGAAKVFAEHTYLSRINELLEMIGLKGK